MRETVRAYCWYSGEIGISPRVPKGALTIIEGPQEKVTEIIHGTARRAYGGKTYLVPGIPEAKGPNETLDALFKYRDWILPRLDRA